MSKFSTNPGSKGEISDDPQHTRKAKHQDRFIFFSANGNALITRATPECLKNYCTVIQAVNGIILKYAITKK